MKVLGKVTLPLFCGLFLVSSCQPSSVEDVMAGTLGFDINHIDSSFSPCEDFFMFASGGWIAENPIPASEARWGSFPILIEENEIKLRGLLEGLEGKEFPKGSYKQQLRDYYISAMDSITVEDLGLESLRPYLDNVNGIKNRNDIKSYLQYAVREQIGVPFGMYVGADSKNSEAYALYFSQSGLGLPDREYYFKEGEVSDQIRQKYVGHITEMLQLAGVENAGRQAADIMALETEIANNHMNRRDQRKPELTYNKMDFESFAGLMPFFNWNTMAEELSINADSVIVRQPDFFRAMDKIFNNSDVDVWKSYFTWHLLRKYSDYLPHDFVKSSFDFYGRALSGTTENKPRWKRSINKINGGLSEPLGRLFSDKYFSPESRNKVEKMVEDIRAVYRERIMENEWMNEDTKEKAIEKLNAFNYKIGYPDNWKDFSQVEILPNDLVGNRQRITVYQFKDKLARLGTAVDKSEWFMGAHVVNAYYSPSFNEIVFPAGILQPPFFDAKADDAVNYGAIGGVIGHEFTHGFDDQGRKYNAFGNLSSWWSTEDSARFAERTQKVVEFYSKLSPVEGYFVDGELTLGENIADIGGLTLAYHAYKKHISKTGSKVINGFTPEQRVFLGWAKVWQSQATEEFLRKQVQTDPHSPSQYRVNATMSMIPEFKQAFECEEDDPLFITEEERAIIW
ncbi:MAG: M13 family metallopeptidase [Cryomorphaceae bacterium]|nr:M13 family metallopeptidase [Cryomorphaceae bacterium]